jgi:ankyrin repeat protein
MGWASHGDHTEMVRLLSRSSRDLWTLCINGYVDRVREILTEEPSRAREVASDGSTPLWWLPDDEAKAKQIVELLLAAGADPSARSQSGGTAADSARRRAMREVVTQLETAAAPSGR